MGGACNLVRESLSPSQIDSCNRVFARTYGTFDRYVEGIGFITGANTLNIASISLDYGLLNDNTSIITDAYRRLHDEVVIEDALRADGIRRDGSFGQHLGSKSVDLCSEWLRLITTSSNL